MSDYRRSRVAGGAFFFTVVTENRAPILCTVLGRRCMRAAYTRCRSRWSFQSDALVLLPDHLHVVWRLPDDDTDYSRRWAYLKKEFTKEWLAGGGEEQIRSASRIAAGRRGVLQRRFWEHAIRDESDLRRHLDYIHFNPVKHGLSTCPHSWPYSTFARWVRDGMYSPDWACVCAGAVQDVPRFDDLEGSAME